VLVGEGAVEGAVVDGDDAATAPQAPVPSDAEAQALVGKKLINRALYHSHGAGYMEISYVDDVVANGQFTVSYDKTRVGKMGPQGPHRGCSQYPPSPSGEMTYDQVADGIELYESLQKSTRSHPISMAAANQIVRNLLVPDLNNKQGFIAKKLTKEQKMQRANSELHHP
jgi:hypothetical protein